jgi:hypothetical protein
VQSSCLSWLWFSAIGLWINESMTSANFEVIVSSELVKSSMRSLLS